MPRWLPRLILMVILSLLAAGLLVIVLLRIRGLLSIFLVALFLSFAIEPAVEWLSRHRWNRWLATTTVLVGAFLLVIVLLALLVPVMVREIMTLIRSVPGWLDSVSDLTERWLGIDLSTPRALASLSHAESSVASYARNVAGDFLGVGEAILGGIFRLLTIGLFTFFLVADGPKFRRAVCSLLPPARQRQVLRAWDIAIVETGGYFYTRLVLAAVSSAASYVVLRLLGLPGALPLALWFGIASQFIPVAGTYIAALLPLFVAVLERPPAAMILLAYVVVYAVIQDYILSPRLARRTMEIHPATTIGAVLVGGSLLGAAGAFLAVPAAATLQAWILVYHRRDEGPGTGPDPV
jgi:predicted PurR-regulated permease PerM